MNAAPTVEAGRGNRPAILLITTDQLRRDALGCYGGRAVATPQLDRLAAEGTVFDRGYTASPWCLPSRAAIVTGRYPHGHGAYSNFRDHRLDPDIPNAYTVLREAGYTTHHVGKCHFAPVPYRRTRPDETLPYQEFRDYYLSLGIDRLWLQDDKQVSVWFADDYARELADAGHLAAYRDAVWDRTARKVFTFPGPAEWHPDAWVGRKAVEAISSHSGDAPWFGWVSFSGPHFPFDPPESYLDRVDESALPEPAVRPGEFDDPARIHHRSWHGPAGGSEGWIESGVNKDYDQHYWYELRRNYFANVALLDDQIGEVLAAAEQRFGDNLLVVFSCDHGEMLGNHGLWGKGNCFYQDVLNVPLILRRPGGTGAGERSQRLVSLVDVFPTLLAGAGADPDRDDLAGIDGVHLDRSNHPYVLAEGEGFVTVTDGRHKLVLVRKGGAAYTELYDLVSDPGEFTDLAGKPEYAQIQRDLQGYVVDQLVDAALP